MSIMCGMQQLVMDPTKETWLKQKTRANKACPDADTTPQPEFYQEQLKEKYTLTERK